MTTPIGKKPGGSKFTRKLQNNKCEKCGRKFYTDSNAKICVTCFMKAGKTILETK